MPMAYSAIGMSGVMIFFALFCASGLFFIRPLPNSSKATSSSPDSENTVNDTRYSWSLKGISLAGILAYNIGIGIVWTYMFLVGLEAGAEVQSVANALTISQFLGIAGAFLAVMCEIRFGRMLPLMIGIIGGAAGIYLLIDLKEFNHYTIGVCAFNFLWNLSMPYLLATLADFDRNGKLVIYGVCMQMIGYAVGPYLAASLLQDGNYDIVNWAGIILFIASAILLIPALVQQKKQRVSAV
jgi:hypothetical protein